MKFTDAALKSFLLNNIATGKQFDPAATFVGLATAVADHGGATTMSNVTEVTGAMATRQAVTAWSSAHKLPDGRWCVDGPVMSFSPLDSAEAQTVTHLFFNSALTAGTLKCFESLPSPADMYDETQVINIVPRLCIDPAGNLAATVVFLG